MTLGEKDAIRIKGIPNMAEKWWRNHAGQIAKIRSEQIERLANKHSSDDWNRFLVRVHCLLHFLSFLSWLYIWYWYKIKWWNQVWNRDGYQSIRWRVCVIWKPDAIIYGKNSGNNWGGFQSRISLAADQFTLVIRIYISMAWRIRWPIDLAILAARPCVTNQVFELISATFLIASHPTALEITSTTFLFFFNWKYSLELFWKK